MKKLILMPSLALAGALIGAPVLAENPAQKPPGTTPMEERSTGTMGTGMGTGQVDEEQLEKYAEARQEIEDITEEHQQNMQDTGISTQERNMLQQNYQRDVAEAIRDNGLTPQQYNTVQSKVMNDPALQQRVEEMM